MNRQEFLQKQFELSVQAGTSQRYHQWQFMKWWRWDTSAKVATAIAAGASAILSVQTAGPNSSTALVASSIAVSVLSAACAVALNVIPFGTWEQQHRDLFRQWIDLREDIDALEFDLDGEPSMQNTGDLKKLEAKSHRICGQEVSPNSQLVKDCYQAEKQSRQFEVVGK